MKNDYSPRDLMFDRIKKIYEKDLLGDSLKHMSDTRKIAL